MNKLIVDQYINKIKKEDIIKFGIKQGIILKKEEVDILYDYIKNKYQSITHNPELVLSDIKDKIRMEVYLKILELYNKYKDKIS